MMSEHLLHFIPETLSYIPDAEQQQAAEQYLSEWMAADDIMHQADPDVMFWSGSENFRYPLCPACRKPVSGVWWGAQMNAIFAVTGQARISAALTPRNTPCCGAPVVIPEMDYDETGGLACYGLTVRYNNSFIVCMDNGRDEIIHRVSECLGTPVRLVWEWI
ncbi:hypothetical protein AB7160_12480 [Morganella morganii]|uniref:hypothetical protein n=1 Tax=Morganella morganii TaxID=582 RepID=UPI0011658506|nr:hypothetical protein [Morganella morganii]QQO71693.1 hypothetical protein IDH72_14660 [Morganella morganii]